MKQYRITKIIFAEDMQKALKKEEEAELVEIVLNEEVRPEGEGNIGFK
jgi:hypothetical protein